MSNITPKFYVGLDVSKKSIEIYILPGNGQDGKSCRINNEPEQIEQFCRNFKEPKNVLMAMESGTDSPWMSELLVDLGFQVVVGNAKKLSLIWRNSDKSDRNDAELLARQARNDLKLFAPIQHQSSKLRAALVMIKMRECAVACRTKMINTVRGTLRSFGADTSDVTVDNFTAKIGRHIPKNLHSAMKEIVNEIRLLQLSIKDYDKKIARLCREYPDTRKVDQISGVGNQTALAFVLILGSTERFFSGGGVGKYFGLTPKRDQSGDVDKQLHITKEGNKLMRKLLVQAAQYVMGLGPECDLRRFGERIASRGGKIAKRKAVVAVARKIAKLMFRLWKYDEVYDPDHKANRKTARRDKQLGGRPLEVGSVPTSPEPILTSPNAVAATT